MDTGTRPAPLTARQTDALEWLRARGKAHRRVILAAGFTVATFDALVDKGVATRTTVGSPASRASLAHPSYIWRPID